MSSKSLCAVVGLALAVFFSTTARAQSDDKLVARADQFISMLQQQDFDNAAKMFHYPPSYDSAELSADRTNVASFLRRLFGEIGNISTVDRIVPPSGTLLTLGESGGNVSYWTSHPELNTTRNVTYRAQVKQDGIVYFVVRFVRPVFIWEIRTFELEIPASQPGAPERMRALTTKLAPRRPAGLEGA